MSNCNQVTSTTVVGSNDEHNFTFVLHFNDDAYLGEKGATGAVLVCEVFIFQRVRVIQGHISMEIDLRIFSYFFIIPDHILHACALSYPRLEFSI